MTYLYPKKTGCYIQCRAPNDYDLSAHLKIENKTKHQIDIVFYYNVAKMGHSAYDSLKAASTDTLTILNTPTGYEARCEEAMRYYWSSDSAFVWFDGKALIKHYRDSIDRKIKSHNRKSLRSLCDLDSYTHTVCKNGKPNLGDADFFSSAAISLRSMNEKPNLPGTDYTYTFTEADYLFARKRKRFLK